MLPVAKELHGRSARDQGPRRTSFITTAPVVGEKLQLKRCPMRSSVICVKTVFETPAEATTAPCLETASSVSALRRTMPSHSPRERRGR